VTLHGKAVVAVTHDLNLASQMHRQIRIVDGRLAQAERLTASDASL
jgi:lipoprotein-releasing system ATP-binding protein